MERKDSDEKIDYSRKDDFSWISMIRIPDFVSPDNVEWAKQAASKKKMAGLLKSGIHAHI